MTCSPLWVIACLLLLLFLLLPWRKAWVRWVAPFLDAMPTPRHEASGRRDTAPDTHERQSLTRESESQEATVDNEERPGGALEGEAGPRSVDLPAKPPRQQYLFAHVLLRMTARGDNEAWRALRRAGREAELLLAALWAQAGGAYGSPFEMRPKAALIARGAALPSSSKAPKVRLFEGGVLVLMPLVAADADAYAIAIVEQGSELRYFTLEKGAQCDFFCEWLPDGVHVNMGPAEGSDAESFLALVRREIGETRCDAMAAVNAPGGAALARRLRAVI